MIDGWRSGENRRRVSILALLGWRRSIFGGVQSRWAHGSDRIVSELDDLIEAHSKSVGFTAQRTVHGNTVSNSAHNKTMQTWKNLGWRVLTDFPSQLCFCSLSLVQKFFFISVVIITIINYIIITIKI